MARRRHRCWHQANKQRHGYIAPPRAYDPRHAYFTAFTGPEPRSPSLTHSIGALAINVVGFRLVVRPADATTPRVARTVERQWWWWWAKSSCAWDASECGWWGRRRDGVVWAGSDIDCC